MHTTRFEKSVLFNNFFFTWVVFLYGIAIMNMILRAVSWFVSMVMLQVLQYGNSVRSRGTSGVNPDSSRSHAVLQMEIRHEDEEKLGK